MDDSIGKFLKNQREAQGVSLENIARDTHISERYLEAIEQEDFKKLPGTFFVRGFIKTYADYIGLDSREILENYRNCFEKYDESKRQSIIGQDFKKRPIALAAAKKKKNFWPAIIGFLLIVGSGLYFMYFMQINGRIAMEQWTGGIEKKEFVKQGIPGPVNNSGALSPVPPDHSASMPRDAGDAHSIPVPLPKSPGHEITIEEAPETPSGKGATEASDTSEDEKPPEKILNPAAFGPPAEEARPEGGKELILSMKANADAWIRLQIDGSEDWKDFILKEGERVTFKAHEQFSLSSGNARAVELSLDGRKIAWPQNKAVIRDFILARPENSAKKIDNPSKSSANEVRDLP